MKKGYLLIAEAPARRKLRQKFAKGKKAISNFW